MLRTAKVLKAARLGRTKKHEEKSEHKMITFGLCEMLIQLISLATSE
jgi:hypothetical protein